jgi:hypothetical protein
LNRVLNRDRHDIHSLKGWRRSRAEVWEIMEDPRSSFLAALVALTVFTFIILSVVFFMMDSVPSISLDKATGRRREPWASRQKSVELLCVIVFTIEYGLRLLTAPNMISFVFSPSSIIDLIAIIPTYVVRGMKNGDDSGSLATLQVRGETSTHAATHPRDAILSFSTLHPT